MEAQCSQLSGSRRRQGYLHDPRTKELKDVEVLGDGRGSEKGASWASWANWSKEWRAAEHGHVQSEAAQA